MMSIKELREWTRHLDENPHLGTLTESGKLGLLAIADTIETEIAGSYMPLPLDADGVPIHVGDTLAYGDYSRGIVKAFNEHMVIAMHVDDDNLNYAKYGLLWEADGCRHFKPRTIEDVLRDVVTLCANTWKDEKSAFRYYDVDNVMESGNIADFAAEIREVLGVSE